MDATAVEGAARYFDEWVGLRRRLDRIPGVQLAVLHEDRVVLSSAHGHADVGAGVALTTEHRFRIASHSKTFTATAVMLLVEEGRLRLDDHLADHLPFLDGQPAGRASVREVLGHASGLVRDGWDGDFWQLDRPFPDRAGLERISTDAADVLAPNERFKYSNIGFGLLGQVIEAVTGSGYHEFVSDRITGTLGLASTTADIGTADPDLPAVATGYSALAYADERIPIDTIPTGALASATGFASTATDVVRYAAAHFEGDDRLLTDASKRLMQRSEWKVEGSGERSYGLGFAVADVGGRRMVGHGGGFPGHITFTMFDPVDRLAVSVLTNCIDGPAQGLASGLVHLVNLATRSAAPPPSPPAGVDTASFCGRYANLWGVFDIVELGGRLHRLDPTLADPTVDRCSLEVIDANTLRIADAPGYASPGERYEFERDEDGIVQRLRGGSAVTSLPFDDYVELVRSHDRVRRPPPDAG